MTGQTRRGFFRRTAALLGGAAGIAQTTWARGMLAADHTFQGKFAICNETFGDWPFEKAFALAADCGYAGIEIAPFTISNYVTDVSANRRRQIRRQAEQSGLDVVGLHWLLAKTKGLHLTSPDAAVRRKTAGYLGALAEFCADLGGKLLIFGSPQQRSLLPGVSRQEGMQYATEVIHAALPTLEKTNVRLAMEPLAPGATSFLNTAADAVELIRRVDSPRCRLILDCKAMVTESKPIVELIRENGSWLIHFHANDPNLQGPGFGDLDFVPIFRALREINYRGWVSVEVFDYDPGAERLARESIQYMRRCVARSR